MKNLVLPKTYHIAFIFFVLIGCSLFVRAETHEYSQYLSLDLPDMPLRDALRLIADKSDANLVIPESINELPNISIKLRDVTFQQALRVLLEPNGYYFVEEGKIVRIFKDSEQVTRATASPNHGFQIDRELGRALIRYVAPKRLDNISCVAFRESKDLKTSFVLIEFSTTGDTVAQVVIASKPSNQPTWGVAKFKCYQEVQSVEAFSQINLSELDVLP